MDDTTTFPTRWTVESATATCDGDTYRVRYSGTTPDGQLRFDIEPEPEPAGARPQFAIWCKSTESANRPDRAGPARINCPSAPAATPARSR